MKTCEALKSSCHLLITKKQNLWPVFVDCFESSPPLNSFKLYLPITTVLLPEIVFGIDTNLI